MTKSNAHAWWSALSFASDDSKRGVVTLELTRDQVKAAPEYKDKQPVVVLGAAGLALFARGAIGGDAVRRAVEEQLSARIGQPVRIASLGSSFFPRVTLDLHGVSIGEPAAATVGEISIVTGLCGLFSRRVEEAEVIVSDGRLPVEMAFRIGGWIAGGRR